jgi:hypothetical protein
MIGRGKRVFRGSLAIRLGGRERRRRTLRKYIEPIGWIALALLAAAIGWLWWRGPLR